MKYRIHFKDETPSITFISCRSDWRNGWKKALGQHGQVSYVEEIEEDNGQSRVIWKRAGFVKVEQSYKTIADLIGLLGRYPQNLSIAIIGSDYGPSIYAYFDGEQMPIVESIMDEDHLWADPEQVIQRYSM